MRNVCANSQFLILNSQLRMRYTVPVRIRVGLLTLAIAIATPRVGSPQDIRPSFADFLAGVRTEALSRGIREEILDAARSMTTGTGSSSSAIGVWTPTTHPEPEQARKVSSTNPTAIV